MLPRMWPAWGDRGLTSKITVSQTLPLLASCLISRLLPFFIRSAEQKPRTSLKEEHSVMGGICCIITGTSRLCHPG